MKIITILLSRVLFTMCHKLMLTDDPKDEIFTKLLMIGPSV